MDINNILLWESSVVTVNYQAPFDWVFNSIEILPSWELKQWDKVTFTVSTVDDVTSAQMLFNDGTSYPLDLLSPGVFKKIWSWQILFEIKIYQFRWCTSD